jgi:hypothetical protein
MSTNFTSIPFTVDEGFSRFAGIAKFSAAGIVFEFESKIFGIIKSGVKEVRFPMEEILDVKFRKGVLKHGAKIEVRTKSFAKLNEMPNREGKVTLKLERDDFERAREAVLALQKELSEHASSLPPHQTRVSSLFDQSEDETKDLGEQ